MTKSNNNNKSNIIGVIFEYYGEYGLGNPLFGQILDSFREELESYGKDVIILSSNKINNMTYAENSKHRDVEGILVLSNSFDVADFNQILENKIPCVTVHDTVQGCPLIVSENYHSGYNAVDYFISKGHKEIGYIGVEAQKRLHASVNRENGFRKGLMDNNLECTEKNIEYCKTWEKEAGKEGIKRLLKKNKSLTAIFMASDILTLGAIEYCNENGIRVPDDISFIGFDNNIISNFTNPPLTTFNQDSYTIGKKMAEILLKMINGESVPDVIQIPTELIIRESVKDLR